VNPTVIRFPVKANFLKPMATRLSTWGRLKRWIKIRSRA
jgi:hypothetical protein